MPFYTVSHAIALSEEQETRIAQAITKRHSELFTTPSLFVNVFFQDVSQSRHYVAGKLSRGNSISGNLRAGPTRSRDEFNSLCRQITDDWEAILGAGPGRNLRAVFINGSLVAAREHGLEVPPAGEDAKWLKVNYPAFKKRADAGEEEFQDLVKEIHTRDTFRDIAQANGANGHA